MATKLKYPKLKQAMFTSPQSKDNQFPMYVIETKADADVYAKNFPQIKKSFTKMYENIISSINEGYIVLATDETISGYPTYCFENTTNSTHPSSFNRIK